MIDAIGIAVFSYLTPITALVAFFAPSVWVVAAAASAVAIAGVVFVTNGQPGPETVGGWLIGQVFVGIALHFAVRKAR